jgi:transposase
MIGKVYVGVDVSKAKLDVCVEGGRAFVLENAPKKIVASLRRLLKEHAAAGLHVCYESTGVYGDALRDACWACGVAVSVLNAKQVRDWAKGSGQMAKTDKIDARVVCGFARAVGAPPCEAPAEWRALVRGLLKLREAFVQQRVLVLGHLEQTAEARFRKRLESEAARLDKQVGKLEAEMVAAVRSDADASEVMARMASVKGIGALTACSVIALVPEIGTLGRKRAAALAGLAPYADDSGTHSGERHIRAGRADLRRALYMPAVCAIRHNLILKAFYKGLRKRGKHAKVALTAVMRRLIILLDRIAGKPGFVPCAS